MIKTQLKGIEATIALSEIAIIIYCFCHSILYGSLSAILWFLSLAGCALREVNKELGDK